MIEPKICPFCGMPTTELQTLFLSKTGLPESAENEVLRLLEQRKHHVHTVCQNCSLHKKVFREFAWVELLGQLWGWVWDGKKCFWRISTINLMREKVQFT